MFDHDRVILRIDPLLVNIANDNRVIRKNRFVAGHIAIIVKLLDRDITSFQIVINFD